MPKVKIKDKHIYYETYGEGEPIVILNGIMMSTASWAPFVDILSEKKQISIGRLHRPGPVR